MFMIATPRTRTAQSEESTYLLFVYAYETRMQNNLPWRLCIDSLGRAGGWHRAKPSQYHSRESHHHQSHSRANRTTHSQALQPGHRAPNAPSKGSIHPAKARRVSTPNQPRRHRPTPGCDASCRRPAADPHTSAEVRSQLQRCGDDGRDRRIGGSSDGGVATGQARSRPRPDACMAVRRGCGGFEVPPGCMGWAG